MKNIILILILLIGTFSNLFALDSPCDDWTAYKDEKCFKILTKVGTKTFEDAEKLCKLQDPTAHLISITFQEEQTFLADFLFNKSKILDNVWIGAKLSPAKKYLWESGAEVSFANWAPGNPKSLDGYCVQLDADVKTQGKWVDEPCGRKNAVVCQKRQTLSIARIQEILFEVKQNPVPIGFIYVQLPKEKAPQEIWPWMTWTDVSSTYDGVFFRVAGKDSAAFGSIQEDNAPRICDIQTRLDGAFSAKPGNDYFNTKVPRGGESNWLYTGAQDGTHMHIKFGTCGGEVRPKNMAMKVWKRTG